MRELQALISYLLFGGRPCERLLLESGNESTSLPQLSYSGQGPLFEILQETFDPARMTHPVWDDLLVGGETAPEDWLPEWHGRNDALDPGVWDNFEARKRALFFFHKHGSDLLTLDSDDESQFATFLEMPERDALRLLIRSINRCFGDDSGGNHLRVWQSHRFNQSPRRVLYSSTLRPRGNFEIAYPRLSSSMAKAFDLAQDHVLFRLKDLPQAKLRVDFPIFELLAQAERGVPVLSLANDATRRLWQFMEKLTKPLGSSSNDSDVKIVVLNTVSGEKLNVTIDPIEKQYLEIIQGEH